MQRLDQAQLNASSKPSKSDATANATKALTTADPIDASALDELWLRMASRYGHSWLSQYGESPAGFAGAEWGSTLSGLTRRDLAIGFNADRARGSEWPPSSTMFRAMCLQIPTHDIVRAELNDQGSVRSPFARLVWTYIFDHHRYRQADAERADRMLGDAYARAREFVMRGGPLPQTPQELAKPETKPHVGMPAGELHRLIGEAVLALHEAADEDKPSEMRLEVEE